MRKSILSNSLTGLLTDTILKKYIFILILGIFSLGSMANPKLASKQQIGMFINSKTCVVLENALFHFHIGPTQNSGAGKCFEMIFDIDGNMYYYNSRKITNDNENGFNLKDFYSIR